jgi:hypothetical protein
MCLFMYKVMAFDPSDIHIQYIINSKYKKFWNIVLD